jgi:hypothetical protein
MRSRWISLFVFFLLTACSSPPSASSPASQDRSPQEEPGRVDEGRGEGVEGDSAAAHAREEAEQTAERLEALAEARADATFGHATQAAVIAPAAGWAGEQVIDPNVDDWEPAVATDPRAPYIYLVTTRYGTEAPCKPHCPSPYLTLTISSNNGATWGSQKALWGVKGTKAQYDPTITVVPNTGVVYAFFLNADRHGGFSTLFIKSSDHGKTWTNPVRPNGQVSWTDKPFITTSASGKDVYVSWNGPTGGDVWMGVSHDHGATWTQTRLVDKRSKRYYYAYDAKTLPDGTVIFSESSLVYTCGGSGSNCGLTHRIWHHAIISRDHGDTWKNVVVAKVPIGEACVADGCGPDFYTGQTSVGTDANGDLVFMYEGPKEDGGPQLVYAKTSTDDGRTWSHGTLLSVPGEDATQPRVVGTGNGDFRLWYMQTSGGDNPDAWNVWYRRSTSGGTTWSAPQLISDAPADAAGYVTAKGFAEIYGDYGEIAITSTGKTIGIWGEGYSWIGPGGCWFNIQT